MAADRLGNLIDQMISACPDATILVAMIINTCDATQEPNTAEYQAMVPEVVKQRFDSGSHVLTVDFSSFPTSDLRDCIHPTNAGYKTFGDYWYDFVTQIPQDWIGAPVGADPERPDGIDANGGLATDIPQPDWGTSPVQVTSQSEVLVALFKSTIFSDDGCTAPPTWFYTGEIATGLGHNGDWQYTKNWVEAGQVASGLLLDADYVRLHDMNGDGKAGESPWRLFTRRGRLDQYNPRIALRITYRLYLAGSNHWRNHLLA